MTLEEMIAAGNTDAHIARKLGCTPVAVNVVRKRRGIPCRRKVLLSARAIAKRLGIPSGDKTVTWWLQEGYLKGRRGRRCGRFRGWYVREGALLDFLADALYWHLWTVARVKDVALGEWVAEIRNGTRFLTTGEAAKLLGVGHAAVHSYIQMGHLPAVRRGNWLIRSEDLAGFVLPCERSKKGIPPRRFTPQQDQRLLALRANGHSYSEIARTLGRSLGSVYARLNRLLDIPAGAVGSG